MSLNYCRLGLTSYRSLATMGRGADTNSGSMVLLTCCGLLNTSMRIQWPW